MTRRVRKGQRARVIGESANEGIIVLVIRPYFYPEKFDGVKWVNFHFPWVVTSLGKPLQYQRTDGTLCPPCQNGVLDDENLEPLEDEDDGLTEDESHDLPAPSEGKLSGLAA
jgi:hypothetical protein